MHRLTAVLENFFDDKVSFFLKGSPIPVYRTRQAVSKLGALSPSKDRLASASSSVSSVYSEEPLGRQSSLSISRCTRSLRSRTNINQKQQDVSEDGESDVESLSASSCNEVAQRQTRSMRKTQLPSLSSSESTCVDEAGHSMRLRTRALEHPIGRPGRWPKRAAEESGDSGEDEQEEEESGEESGEESDSGEEYVEARSQRGRGKRGKRGRGRGRVLKRGPPRGGEGRHLRKRRRVSSYSEEEAEGGDYREPVCEITSRSGRVVKPATKFS